MAEEENQVTTKEVTTKRLTTKNPKKVEAGKRLAEYNHRKREAQICQVLTSSQYYSIGALLAVGVIGGLGYYLYQAKANNVVPSQQPPPQQPPKANKFEME